MLDSDFTLNLTNDSGDDDLDQILQRSIQPSSSKRKLSENGKPFKATTKTFEQTKAIKASSSAVPSQTVPSLVESRQKSTSKHPPSSTRKVYTPEEDPQQYHANPTVLSRDALKAARPVVSFLDHVFTRSTFSSLNVHDHLASILQQTKSNGGLGLSTATRVQSVAFPLLRPLDSLQTRPQNMLMKSQTGSGKTLAYLLPIVDDLMRISPQLNRAQGTRALIIAPTRELCCQISDVLASLTQACVWVVSGSITGGEKKKSEKARLRKGIVALVCTPGRLLDHLKTTESLDLSLLRWLVLDEADRLLDMGFEQTLLEIISIIHGRSLPKLKIPIVTSTFIANKTCKELNNLTHVMVSATITRSVQELSLPLMNDKPFVVVDADAEKVTTIKSIDDITKVAAQTSKSSSQHGITSFEDENSPNNSNIWDQENSGQPDKVKMVGSQLEDNEQVDTPQQLAQYYMNVTCKWRLAALISFLRTKVTMEKQKVMVFFSTCDAVDYHALLMRETNWPTRLDNTDSLVSDDSGLPFFGENTTTNSAVDKSQFNKRNQIELLMQSHQRSTGKDKQSHQSQSQQQRHHHLLAGLGARVKGGLLGQDVPVFRLHGNMAHSIRQEVYKEFCASQSSVMLCTDVAARGLDLPKVDWILQYDPPCDITDYVHRAGRTARQGLGGSALLFLLPSESPFVPLLFSHNLKPEPLSLQSLFLGVSQLIPGSLKFKNVDELAAVILQRRLEIVVEKNKLLTAAGQQAFRSFVRAYASHSVDTKGIFRVQNLHLGHVAKSFALRSNPAAMRNRQDIIGEIANGKHAQEVTLDKAAKQALRDEKYSLSNQALSKTKRKLEDNSGNSSGNRYRSKPNATGEGVAMTSKKSRTLSNPNSEAIDETVSTKPVPVSDIDETKWQRLKVIGKLSSSKKKAAKVSVRKQMAKSLTSEFSL